MFAPDGTWTIRSYDGRQEEEASWLSGCLLLPRPALLTIAGSDLSLDEGAARYGVSVRLLKYRTDVTGVRAQDGDGGEPGQCEAVRLVRVDGDARGRSTGRAWWGR